jgi:Na+-transporting methylmalonyl-CoA/oxaloacetate decarboxylase gamma subunit
VAYNTKIDSFMFLSFLLVFFMMMSHAIIYFLRPEVRFDEAAAAVPCPSRVFAVPPASWRAVADCKTVRACASCELALAFVFAASLTPSKC